MRSGWLVSGSVCVLCGTPGGGVFGRGTPLRPTEDAKFCAPSVNSRPPEAATLQNELTLWVRLRRTSGELNVWFDCVTLEPPASSDRELRLSLVEYRRNALFRS